MERMNSGNGHMISPPFVEYTRVPHSTIGYYWVLLGAIRVPLGVIRYHEVPYDTLRALPFYCLPLHYSMIILPDSLGSTL